MPHRGIETWFGKLCAERTSRFLVAHRELFGFPTGIGGGEPTARSAQFTDSARKFSTPAATLSLEYHPKANIARVSRRRLSAVLLAKALLIATGANYRRLDAEGREQFEAWAFIRRHRWKSALSQQTVVVAGSGDSHQAMFP